MRLLPEAGDLGRERHRDGVNCEPEKESDGVQMRVIGSRDLEMARPGKEGGCGEW